MDFPITSSPKPPFKIEPEDNIIRSKMEDGMQLTRPRSSKARKKIELKWDLNNAEYLLLDNFYDNETGCGSLPFNLTINFMASDNGWGNAAFSITKQVNFSEPPEYSYVGMGAWEVTCKFLEV